MDSSSDSDCEMDDISLFPMSDFDVDTSNNNARGSTSSDSAESDERANNSDDAPEPERLFKPAMSLRQRRRSKSQPLKFNLNNLVMNQSDICGSPKGKWFTALKKAQYLDDPWEKFCIEALPEERAVRHRYNALSKQWKVDDVIVKMETEAFNHGAMRACYRLKKLSNFSHRAEWKYASNYVAKLYMEDVDRDVYFEDVKLQMDAKLWGEEYNRHNPPKKVDIFQMSVLEFKDRPGCPLYHLEHFIEGNYIKYNSNSGFVDEHLRLTPQAFSHFTFERSGHQLIIVDIQGVDDLWTDPQIHTTKGEEYGDGNLGTRGMALFFHSHTCNSICESLELTKFDLAESEIKAQEKFIKMLKSGGTVVKGHVEHCVSALPRETVNLTDFLARSRARNMSSCSSGSTDEAMCSPPTSRVKFCIEDEEEEEEEEEEEAADDPMSPGTPDGPPTPLSPLSRLRNRVRYESESDSNTLTKEEERIRFQTAVSHLHRPSSVAHELNMRAMQNTKRMGDSVLGQIHHDMAKYHDMGRFSLSDTDIDVEAALYHEQQAAHLGVLEAILTMADIYLGLQHDILTNVVCEQTQDNIDQGVEYMQIAADAGSRPAMLYLARAYETGHGLSINRTQSWISAVQWYEEAIARTQADESGDFDATMDQPVYQLQAKVAELLMGGKFGLNKDPQRSGDMYTEAAEGAMAAMKGRLANKYYALAEEAWAEVEEE